MDSNSLAVGLPPEALGMGNPSAAYKIANFWSWAFAVIFGLVGLLACAITAFAGVSTVTDSSNQEGAILSGVCFGVIALGLLGLAGWQGYAAVQKRSRRVVVLDSGLVRVNGKKSDVIRWDDVATVFQAITNIRRYGMTVSTTYAYTVYLKNNTKFLFNNSVNNISALGETIQNEVTKRLLPQYLQTYNSGGSVTFGKFTLSQAGISNGWETIPWDQVDAVNINNGFISVRKQGKWLNWAGQSAANTPNLFIFLNMVNQIVGINQKRKQ